jgi:hypothetical protein
MSIRTHEVGHAERVLSRRPEPVLVSTIGHLAREGGAFYGDHRWLTATTPGDLDFAVDVLRRAGIREFALVEPGGASQKRFAGWVARGRNTVYLFSDYPLSVTTYRASTR